MFACFVFENSKGQCFVFISDSFMYIQVFNLFTYYINGGTLECFHLHISHSQYTCWLNMYFVFQTLGEIIAMHAGTDNKQALYFLLYVANTPTTKNLLSVLMLTMC